MPTLPKGMVLEPGQTMTDKPDTGMMWTMIERLRARLNELQERVQALEQEKNAPAPPG